MSDSGKSYDKGEAKEQTNTDKLRSMEQRLLMEKVSHTNCNDVDRTGQPETEPGPPLHGGAATEAADGPRAGSVLLAQPAPLGFSLKHNCSCILHHWKLQDNIKSVGLWVAVHVFLGTCGPEAGKPPQRCSAASRRMSLF